MGADPVQARAVPAHRPGDFDVAYGSLRGATEFDIGVLNGFAMEPDGGVVTVGYHVGVAGAEDAVVARFRPDGRRDRGFGTVTLPGSIPGDERAHAAVVQPNGRIVVVGTVNDAAGLDNFAIWRLMPSGALDTSFGGDGLVELGDGASDDTAFDVALGSGGRIVIAGATTGTGSFTGEDIALVRLTPSGVLDGTFNSGSGILTLPHPGQDMARSVAVLGNDDVLLAGNFDGTTGNAVLKIKPGTTTTMAALDTSFDGDHDGNGVVGVDGTLATSDTDLAVTSTGRILVLDQVVSPAGNGDVEATVVRLTSSGSVDTSFGPAGSTTGTLLEVPGTSTIAEALTLLPSGGAAVVGQETPDLSTSGIVFVAKLRADGVFDPRMGLGGIEDAFADGELVDVAGAPDGRILMAGNTAGTDVTMKNLVFRLWGDLRPPTCAGRTATLVGTAAADRIVGTSGPDVIAGRGGADTSTGLGRGDVVCGGPGNDHISGGAGRDHLYGQSGRDTLNGGSGKDRLVGGPGRDRLRGGPGRDTLRP